MVNYKIALIFIPIIVGLSALTIKRNMAWKDSETLWRDALSKEISDIACINLGAALLDKGRAEEAIPYYMQALQINVKMHRTLDGKPHSEYAIEKYLLATKNIALAYIKTEKFDLAIPRLKEYLKFKDDAVLHNNLGVLLANKGNYMEAVFEFKKALIIRPDYQDALHNLRAIIDLQTIQKSIKYQ